MRPFFILWRRELAVYFRTPLGYFLGAVYLLGAGFSFWWQAGQQAFEPGMAPYLLFQSALFWVITLVNTAVLSMRLIAEERATGTLDLLLSAPVHEATIVGAKYAGALTIFVVFSVPALSYPWILRVLSRQTLAVDPGPLAAGYLILLLMGGLFLAIGLCFSCLTRHQLLAGSMCFALTALIFISGQFHGAGAPFRIGRAAVAIDPSHYVLVFARGLVDSRAIIACLTGTLWALFSAVKALQWVRFRTVANGLNLVFASSLMAALMLQANVLTQRHYFLADWTSTRFFQLSAKSESLLENLNADVEAIVLCRTRTPLFTEIRLLLEQYENRGRRFHVVYIDPDRDLARAKELVMRERLSKAEWVLFRCRGRSVPVAVRDLVGTDAGGVRSMFHGEQLFSAAILEVTQTRRPTVYFLAGSGEHAIDDFHEHTGYAKIARVIRRDSIEVKTVTLDEAAPVPEDCDALIVAGPEQRLPRSAIQAIGDYLRRNGRLMLLTDAGDETGLESVLKEWGVRLNDDRVVAGPRFTGEGFRPGRTERVSRALHITRYGNHPITRDLKGVLTTFYRTRSLTPLNLTGTNITDQADKPRVAVLAASDRDGWAETDPLEDPPQFNPDEDARGPVPIAVAIEKGPASGIAMEIAPTRMVIVGDSEFAVNGCLTGGNQDFFMNAVNWLLRREAVIGIAPKSYYRVTQILDSRARRIALLWIVLGIPAACFTAGLLMHWMRRGE